MNWILKLTMITSRISLEIVSYLSSQYQIEKLNQVDLDFKNRMIRKGIILKISWTNQTEKQVIIHQAYKVTDQKFWENNRKKSARI